MIQVLIGSSDPVSMVTFQTAMDENGIGTTRLESGHQVISKISDHPIDLLISYEWLADMSGLDLIRSVIKTHPTLNCAVVSSLSADEFHEASEGLGILMKLPVAPGRKAAGQLLKQVKKIQAIETNLVDIGGREL